MEQYDVFVHSSFTKYKLPCIIRLKRYVKRRHHLSATFSRSNIFRRDKHTCQYCCKRFLERDLTLDHIMPVSRGGKKTWENITTACRTCNQKKANKTPKEANLKLLTHPVTPKWHPEIHYERFRLHFPNSWKAYLNKAG